METLSSAFRKEMNLLNMDDTKTYEKSWDFIIDDEHPLTIIKKKFVQEITLAVAGDYQTPQMKESRVYIFLFFKDDENMQYPVKVLADFQCNLKSGDILDPASFFTAFRKHREDGTIIKRGFANKTGEHMDFDWKPSVVTDKATRILNEIKASMKK